MLVWAYDDHPLSNLARIARGCTTTWSPGHVVHSPATTQQAVTDQNFTPLSYATQHCTPSYGNDGSAIEAATQYKVGECDRRSLRYMNKVTDCGFASRVWPSSHKVSHDAGPLHEY